MLKYISYVSEQTHCLSQICIEELLEISRSNNATNNITGLLIFFEGVFTQFFEGPEKEVDALYEKIQSDSRHKNVRELFSGHSQFRFYSDWSMAYKTMEPEKAQQITGYKIFDKSKFFEPVSNNEDHPGVMLLESFVDGLHFF